MKNELQNMENEIDNIYQKLIDKINPNLTY